MNSFEEKVNDNPIDIIDEVIDETDENHSFFTSTLKDYFARCAECLDSMCRLHSEAYVQNS